MSDERILRRLKESFDPSMDEEALAQEDPVSSLQFSVDTHTEPVSPGCSLEVLDEIVSRGLKKFDRFDTRMDRELAIGIHKALPIDRRTASDKRVWWYLGLEYSKYVCHRWKPGGGNQARNQDRFLGNLKGREPRNTFARLWWVCELTIVPDGDYALTEKLLALPSFQDLFSHFGGRHFSFHRPTLEAFIREAGDKGPTVYEEVAKRMGNVFSTLVIEALDPTELCTVVGEIVVQVEKQQKAKEAADEKKKAETKKKSG